MLRSPQVWPERRKSSQIQSVLRTAALVLPVLRSPKAQRGAPEGLKKTQQGCVDGARDRGSPPSQLEPPGLR
eukprot:9481463-Pyramimonas_sp.AAC.1